MDGDPPRPPHAAALPATTARREGVDTAVGTRHAGTDQSDGLAGAGRQATSSSATRLVKAAFPRRLTTVGDPLSGLFAFRRDAVDADRLRPGRRARPVSRGGRVMPMAWGITRPPVTA
jgi:hypothetical protein